MIINNTEGVQELVSPVPMLEMYLEEDYHKDQPSFWLEC